MLVLITVASVILGIAPIALALTNLQEVIPATIAALITWIVCDKREARKK